MRVRGTVVFLNDDGVPSKGDITLLRGEEEREEVGLDMNRMME
jgi:hypothetical protein